MGNTEYYMATWGYEFYLLVLKVSVTSERKRLCNVVCFIDTDEIPT